LLEAVAEVVVLLEAVAVAVLELQHPKHYYLLPATQ
jgi:hypothetical protein